jgi:flagellar assembly factor FliW
MPTIRTKQFGTIDYTETDVFEFPAGLPGFESETRFLCIERPALRPIVFLQSVTSPELCFITLPASSVDPAYQVEIANEDLTVLGVAPEYAETSLSCLAIVCLNSEGPPTANLLGPVILSRQTRKGIQAVRDDRRYSALTPVGKDANASPSPATDAKTSGTVNYLAEV